ncbi:J domain-containing protein [Cyanobium sp. HWJ4-Hawea]|uniref:J domain-containing protein n=1 Tax=Cyanobium sp. HWJ4-Hawea TaxID=2823713 RepID=UPI0020CEF517|nr:J domain-containing protein [Cyanobium sp. HWJ4-Hawea]MCP9809708.1 J domain-containing protein [Cyanobium sp. HWJ4-Hawea]
MTKASSPEKTSDALGYYKLLGVEIGCSNDEIKKAYKKMCLKLHPDVNPASDANESFLNLQKAYEILNNSQKRAEYDTKCVRAPNSNQEPPKEGNDRESTLEPIRCSKCNCVTAQPRYVVFWETLSFLNTVRTPIQGVMCINCAGDAAYEATKKSLIFGWWGIWGIILTPLSVIGNLIGGDKPAQNNGGILLYQSWYFAQNNRPELAFILASEALYYLKKSSAKDKNSLVSICQSIIDTYRQDGEGKSLADVWGTRLPRSSDQWKAVGVCCAGWIAGFVGLIGISLLSGNIEGTGSRAGEEVPEYTFQTPKSSNEAQSSDPYFTTEPTKEIPIPQIYLPLSTGYLPSKEVSNDGGRSEITLKNNSEINFHVKLYKEDQGIWVISRELYLKGNEEFTLKNLEPGQYEIRRKDVQSKNASKTRAFTMEETRTDDAINYTTLTITLNAIHGNSRIIPISAADF